MLSTTATHEPSGLAGRTPAARTDPSSYRTAAGWVIAGLWLAAIVYVVTLYHVGDRGADVQANACAGDPATDRHAVPGIQNAARSCAGAEGRSDTAMRDASGTLLGFGEISRPVD